MDNSRRSFLKKAALLSGTAALGNMMPPVLQKALAINPEKGSSFYDAEHIVFLMQENRSFDHLFGSLKGVRGFNDPRAIELPGKNRVWLQTNKKGETYLPFRLNTKDTKVPWMGSTPHGWADQTDARNQGKYNRWLDVKRSHNKDYADLPLTMGYCDRRDFPFYYALADAFTVCDQNFCSSITGTHPNRYYWFTGTIREKNSPEGIAQVWNHAGSGPYSKLTWKTYPERLQQAGVSWKVYQNELSTGYGKGSQERAWLSNFGTNPLEWFEQYHANLHEGTIANLTLKEENILDEIARLKGLKSTAAVEKKLLAAQKVLRKIQSDKTKYTKQAYDALPEHNQQINKRAFTINTGDPDFQTLTKLSYDDSGTQREIEIPKGDVLHAFRQDVKNGTLPMVSWLAPPANFSDHPGRPWFGSWFVNEVMEILTDNPEVWKKTIFILTYDENDGFFDHVPPYAVPNPYKQDSGKVSSGIDARLDFVTNEQQYNPSASDERLRESSLGLGFRVPMIIASPWTKGGYVNSQIFDHTSSLRFLENFLEKKIGKTIIEENISSWRRAICGDLTSVFRQQSDNQTNSITPMQREPFIAGVHKTLFKDIPTNFKALSPREIQQVNENPSASAYFPRQEKGVRPACGIPYELYLNGDFDRQSKHFNLHFKAGNDVFGSKAAGSPFLVYAINPYQNEEKRTWEYALEPGSELQDTWRLDDFSQGKYHLRAYGPNGFFREFAGDSQQPMLQISCFYEAKNRGRLTALTGNIILKITNLAEKAIPVQVKDNAYGQPGIQREIKPGEQAELPLDLKSSNGWYDVSVSTSQSEAFLQRFAGHVETGEESSSDPLMGGII